MDPVRAGLQCPAAGGRMGFGPIAASVPGLRRRLDRFSRPSVSVHRRPGRVGEGVASLPSRRSGLAQLRHPARRAAASRALCYLPAFREQHPGLGVPDLSPTSSSAARRPLPSAGSPSHRFPRHRRYYEALRLPATVPPRFRVVRSAVPPRAPVFVPPLRPDAGLGPGAFGAAAPTPLLVEMESTGSPKVPRQPWCTYALLFDPGGTGHALP